MKVIIIGCGEVGRYLTRMLIAQRYNVTCIDKDADRLSKIEEEFDVQTIRGIGSSVTVLNIAEISGNDIVVAVTGDDESNLTAASFAKKLGAKYCIARVRHPSYLAEDDAEFYQNCGIDMIISPEKAAAREIADRIIYPGVISREDFAGSAAQLNQLLIVPESNSRGIKISEVKMPENSLILSIMRKDDIIIPSGSDVICAQDVLTVLSSKKISEQVMRILQGEMAPIKRVTVIGGTYIGLFLCKMLELNNVDVKIFEPEKEKCEFLAEHLTTAKIINGSGLDKDLLLEENVDYVDMIVSVTENDEINITAGLLAKSIGIKDSVIINHNPNFVNLFKQTGLFHAVDPRKAIVSRMLGQLQGNNISLMSIIKEGEAEIIEIEISGTSKIANKPIRTINLPKSLLIAMIIRNDEIMIPSGNDQVVDGDKVIIFAKKEALKSVDKLIHSRS